MRRGRSSTELLGGSRMLTHARRWAVPLTRSILPVYQEFFDDELGEPSTESGVSSAGILPYIFPWHVGNDGGAITGAPQAGTVPRWREPVDRCTDAVIEGFPDS
jgi:hypothetical protein